MRSSICLAFCNEAELCTRTHRQPPAKVIGYFSIVPITFRLVRSALFYLQCPASVSVSVWSCLLSSREDVLQHPSVPHFLSYPPMPDNGARQERDPRKLKWDPFDQSHTAHHFCHGPCVSASVCTSSLERRWLNRIASTPPPRFVLSCLYLYPNTPLCGTVLDHRASAFP